MSKISTMQSVFQLTLLVPDYDEAIAFYVGKLGFELIEDTPISEGIRWVVVKANEGAALVLARAENEAERRAIGEQTAGRVAFFLATNDIDRDFERYEELGVGFSQSPTELPHGVVAIFADPFGNKWDLIQLPKDHRFGL